MNRKICLLPLTLAAMMLVACGQNNSSAVSSASVPAATSSVPATSTPATSTPATSTPATTSEATTSAPAVVVTPIGDIAEAKEYTVKGVVVAIYTKGYLISDGTGAILVYTNAAADKAIGDYVKVVGTVAEYNALWQFPATSVITALDKSKAPTVDTNAVAMTKAIADGFVLSATAAPSTVKKYSWDSVAAEIGGYMALPFADSTVVIEPAYYDSAIYALEAAKSYHIEAYFLGYSSKHSYAAVMLTKAEAFVPAPTGVTVTAAAPTCVVGETDQMTAVVAPASAVQTVTWSVANADGSITTPLATISEAGLLTGVGAGSVVVTAASTVDPTLLGTVTVAIEAAKPNPTALTISASAADILVGGTSQLAVAYTPENAKTGVTYASATEGVATVSADGLITGVALGTSVITVTSTIDTTISAAFTIHVVEKKTVAAVNALATLDSDANCSQTVYAISGYDAKHYGFMAAAIDGSGTMFVYAKDSANASNVVAGKYYDITAAVSIYNSVYEAAVSAATVENTTCTHYLYDFASKNTLDFSTAGLDAVTTFFQGLVAGTAANAAGNMTMMTLKNVYVEKVSSNYNYLEATKGTAWSCLTAAGSSYTIKLAIYGTNAPASWIDADTLCNVTAYWYTTNKNIVGATANVICRLAAATITAAN